MILGKEIPRLFTPPLRELTPETSLGFAMIEFARILGIDFLPWQKWLSIHALELREDGRLRFSTLLVLVARQNGKSTWAKVLVLFMMIVRRKQLVLGTASELDLAEDLWGETLDLLNDATDEDPVGDLAQMIGHTVNVNGRKSFRLKLPWKPMYKVRAASRKAGRGKAADVVILDELREHQDWAAWGAISKTIMSKDESLIVCITNAGDATSVVLRHLRMQAHALLGDPDGIVAGQAMPAPPPTTNDEGEEIAQVEGAETFFAEWSAPPESDRWDRAGWAQSNPSMNHMRADGVRANPESKLVAAANTDPDHVFFPENMCRWWQGSTDGPFPAGTWEDGIDEASAVADPLAVTYAVDTSFDRTMTHIGIVGRREDGAWHGEVVAQRAGIDWVREWILTRATPERPIRLAYQGRGAPASTMANVFEVRETDTEAMREALKWVTLVPIEGAALTIACGRLHDAVTAAHWQLDQDAEVTDPPERLYHRPQPVLDLAAATAVLKPAGDGFLWDRRRSTNDASPLCAITWALADQMTAPPAFRSAYEDHDLVFV